MGSVVALFLGYVMIHIAAGYYLPFLAFLLVLVPDTYAEEKQIATVTVYEPFSTVKFGRIYNYWTPKTKYICLIGRENELAWDLYDLRSGRRIVIEKRIGTMASGLRPAGLKNFQYTYASIPGYLFGTDTPIQLTLGTANDYFSGRTFASNESYTHDGFGYPPASLDADKINATLDRIAKLDVLEDAKVAALKNTAAEVLKKNEDDIAAYKRAFKEWQAGAEYRSADEYERFALDVRKAIPATRLSGKVAAVNGGSVFINVGSESGVKRDQKFIVYRDDKPISDPDTGEVLGKSRVRQGEITVKLVQEKLSQGQFLPKEDGIMAKPGDLILIDTPQNSAIAILPPAEVANLDVDGRTPDKNSADDPKNDRVESVFGFAVRSSNSNGVSERGKYTAEKLTTALVAKGVPVVERALLYRVLSEISLQRSGTDDKDGEDAEFFKGDFLRKFGEQIGAAYAVVGSVKALPQDPRIRTPQTYENVELNLRLINVETGEIILAKAFAVAKPK